MMTTTSNLRVVIDTNVVLSASIWADSVPFKAVLAATRVGQVLLSLEANSFSLLLFEVHFVAVISRLFYTTYLQLE